MIDYEKYRVENKGVCLKCLGSGWVEIKWSDEDRERRKCPNGCKPTEDRHGKKL